MANDPGGDKIVPYRIGGGTTNDSFGAFATSHAYALAAKWQAAFAEEMGDDTGDGGGGGSGASGGGGGADYSAFWSAAISFATDVAKALPNDGNYNVSMSLATFGRGAMLENAVDQGLLSQGTDGNLSYTNNYNNFVLANNIDAPLRMTTSTTAGLRGGVSTDDNTNQGDIVNSCTGIS